MYARPFSSKIIQSVGSLVVFLKTTSMNIELLLLYWVQLRKSYQMDKSEMRFLYRCLQSPLCSHIWTFMFYSMVVQEGCSGHLFSLLMDLHCLIRAQLLTTKHGEASLIRWWLPKRGWRSRSLYISFDEEFDLVKSICHVSNFSIIRV